MNIEKLKLAIEISKLLDTEDLYNNGLNCMIGKKVIIRTYSAGVWYGILEQKDGSEVIIKNARRMWSWHAEKGISLSGVSVYGVKEDLSKIEVAVELVWLEAIEIIPVTSKAEKSIEECEDAQAK